MYICVSIVLCIFCVCFRICFILLLRDHDFLIEKETREERKELECIGQREEGTYKRIGMRKIENK
jgi:hypothetical protein